MPAQAERLVHEHLLNPAEYAPGSVEVQLLDHLHQPERTELGSPPLLARPGVDHHQLAVAGGLGRYGYADLAARRRERFAGLIRNAGFWEYFDAGDGSGCGSPDFSWSAALAIELLAGFRPRKGARCDILHQPLENSDPARNYLDNVTLKFYSHSSLYCPHPALPRLPKMGLSEKVDTKNVLIG